MGQLGTVASYKEARVLLPGLVEGLGPTECGLIPVPVALEVLTAPLLLD
jgi:hypothetical protein